LDSNGSPSISGHCSWETGEAATTPGPQCPRCGYAVETPSMSFSAPTQM
jgi:hypothetical protein